MRPAGPGRDTAPAAGALPAVPRVRGPLEHSGRVSAARRAGEREGFELSPRLGRNRRRHAHDQLLPREGLAQRRLARLDPAATRQPHALPHRRARGRADSAELDYDVRRGGLAPLRARPGCGSTRPRSRRAAACGGLPASTHALRSRERGRHPADGPSRQHGRPAGAAVPPRGNPGGDPRVRPRHRQPDDDHTPRPLCRRDSRPRAGAEPGPRAARTRWRSRWPRASCLHPRNGRSSRRSRAPTPSGRAGRSRSRSSIALPVMVETEDSSRTDGITTGRAVPSGTYHWFFPDGTRAAVSGRMNEYLRVQLCARVGGVDLRGGGSRAVPGVTRGARGGRLDAAHAVRRPGAGPHPAQPPGALPGHRARARSHAPPLRRAGRRELDPVRLDRHAGAPRGLGPGPGAGGHPRPRALRAALGLPRELGAGRPAARRPPASASRAGGSLEGLADRGGPGPSAGRLQRARPACARRRRISPSVSR